MSLVAYDAEAGHRAADDSEQIQTSWPVIQPGIPRRSQYFCMYIPCVLPVAVLAYFAGVLGFIVIFGAVAVLYVLCGFPVWAAWLWTKSWGFCPWSWLSDLYPKVLFLGFQIQLVGSSQPGGGPKDMPVSELRPKEQLKKYNVDYALNLKVPVGTEEEFGGHRTGSIGQFFEESLAKLPMTDRFDAFAEGEDPVEFVMRQLGSVYPNVIQVWHDKQSDEALTRFCFYGLGAHRVEITKDKQFYVVRTNALSAMPVRDGFARYGGDAYFDMSWRPVKIVDAGWAPARSDGQLQTVVTTPDDEKWAEAKFRFRSSMSVLVTVADHLYGIHLQTANVVVTAVRECLAADHPVRRFLTPYTFQTISVNDNARNNLIQPRSMSSRCFAFTDHGLGMLYASAPNLLKSGLEVSAADGGPILNREKYIEHLRNEGIDTPYYQQSLKYWRITRQFVVDYLACYYPTPLSVTQDPELQAMLLQVSFQLQVVTPEEMLLTSDDPSRCVGSAGCVTTKKSHLVADLAADPSGLYDRTVDIIANYMYLVTTGHEQVGAVEAYVQDASFCSFKWVPGALIGTKQTATAQALLMSFTSTPMPKLLGSNWTHLFPEPPSLAMSTNPPSQTYFDYQRSLEQLSEECQAWNETASTRTFPYNFPLYVLDPANLETSVSV